MTQFNSFNPSYSSPDIEGAMNKILKKRTGKNLQRNVEAARLPQHQKLDKDEVANQIFDNIINKRVSRAEEPERVEEIAVEFSDEIQDNLQADATASYYDEMDAILFGGESVQHEPLATAAAPQVSSYDILDQVLLGGEQEGPTEPLRQQASAQYDSRDDFSRTLDDLLDNHENPFV